MMYFRIIISSVKRRAGLYVPMLIAVSISLCLIGAEAIVTSSFDELMNKEMLKYGANVILKSPLPANTSANDEIVKMYTSEELINGRQVLTALVSIPDLLKMNKAWLVMSVSDILVGEDAAAMLHLHKGDTVQIGGVRNKAAILESGTEFDSYVFINKKVDAPNMELIRASTPAKYTGTNAVILSEMLKTKNAVLESVKKLMFFVALISMLVAAAAIINLTRTDAGARRKEFGIFKSLGASYKSILKLISGEFMLLAVVSFVAGASAAALLSWMILSFAADAVPQISFGSLLVVAATSCAAFLIAVCVYLIESRRMDAAEELRNE